MSEAVQIDISVAQPQQAASVLEAMAAATEKLAKREAEYQEMLAKRAGLYDGISAGLGAAAKKYEELRRKIETPLPSTYDAWREHRSNSSTSVYGPPRPQNTDERYRDKYEQYERQRREKMEPPPGAATPNTEQLYQEKLEREKRRIEERYRMNRDLEESGHKRSKSEEMEAKRIADEKKQNQRGDEGAWMAMVLGRPVEAVATGFLGVGTASAAVMAGLYALKSGFEGVAQMSHYSHLKYMPEDIRQQRMIESIPIIGPVEEWIRKQENLFTGKSANAQDFMAVERKQNEARQEGWYKEQRTTYPMYLETQKARRRAGLGPSEGEGWARGMDWNTDTDGRASYSAPKHTGFVKMEAFELARASMSRDTIEGQREFERAQLGIGPRIAQHAARGQRVEADDNLRFTLEGLRVAERRLAETRSIASELQRQSDERDAKVKAAGPSPGFFGKTFIPGLGAWDNNQRQGLEPSVDNLKLESALVLANKNVLEATKDLQSRILEQQRDEVALAKAVNREKMAGIDVAKAELAFQEAKERRVQNRVSSAGRMNEVEYQLALNSMQMFREAEKRQPGSGADAIMPEMLSQAQQLYPDEVQKSLDLRGERRERQYGAVPSPGDGMFLGVERQQTIQAETQIKINFAANAEEMAKQIAAALSRELGIDKIAKLIKMEVEIQTQNMGAIQRLAHTAEYYGR